MTQAAIEIHDARVFTKAQHVALIQDRQAQAGDTAKAQDIVQEAQAQAQQIIAQAEARAAQMDRDLAAISDQALQRFLNEDVLNQTVEGLANLLTQSQRVREDLEQVETWIKPLIQTAVVKIIGTLPHDTVWTGLINQSLAEVRDRWELVLRCHPSRQTSLTQLIEAAPALSKAIREVQGDRSLGIEDCHLVTGQGVLDIGVETQINTFLDAVERALIADEVSHA